MSEKIIRDPVHDVIAFRMEDATDALLFRLLNAAEFQRLRRIRQLGMAQLAYPGADHSRYSHSLGVMETARKMLAQLATIQNIEPRDRTICLAAALLHDLGHGPFSHVFERVSEIAHEKLTQRIILDPGSEVHQLLAEHDGQLPRQVCELLRGETPYRFLADILASQLDADRFDYLLRDNLMTGSQYGNYDLHWLLHALVIDPRSQRLAVTWKGISAIEDYLQSRYHMYRNVYFHKVVRSSEGMLKLALQRAKRLAVQGRLAWPPRDHGVYKALVGQRLSIEEFTELDDISVLHCFKLWQNCEDAVLASLCKGILFRRLYKTIDITPIEDADRVRELVSEANGAVESAGGDPAYDLFYDEPSDSVYERHIVQAPPDKDGILIREPGGELRDFSTMSPLPAAMDQRLMFRRIHVREQFKDVVLAVVRRASAV